MMAAAPDWTTLAVMQKPLRVLFARARELHPVSHDDTGITTMSTRAPRMSWRCLNDLSDRLANAILNFAFRWHEQKEDQSHRVLRTSSLRYCIIASNTRLMVLSSRSGPRYLDD